MNSKPKLNPQILDYLHKRLKKKKVTIRSDISRLKRDYPHATSNAIAQLYAQQHRESVRRLISKEDKLTIPSVKIEKAQTLKSKKKKNKQEKIKIIIKYETSNHFLKKHITEINRAYAHRCYTSVFVLLRKVLENLIIEIMKAKYQTNRELYFDVSRGRNQDFSMVLDNLFKKRNDFGDDSKKAIERLQQKLKPFKNDANDKVHSLYHIVENPQEIDEWNLDSIMALITEIK